MPNVSHKFISVYSKAQSNSVSNSNFNLFLGSNYASPDFTTGVDAESNNTFSESTGQITIGAGGQYHAFISLNCDGTGGIAFCTIKILVNSVEVYGSLFVTDFSTYSGGGERTFSTILQLSDNDLVQVIVNTNDGSVGIFNKPGTTFSLVSMESAYGINTRTGNEDKNTTEHNPFQSGTYSQAYTSAFTSMSGGIGYTDTGWQSTYGNSPTFAVASYQPIIADDQQITYKLYKNASAVAQYSAYSFSGEIGYERTVPAIITLSANPTYDYVKPTMNASVGDGAYINSGSSFSLDRIRESAYTSMTFNNASNTISTNGNYLSFLDQGSYASFSRTDLATPADISYSSNPGGLTINTSGYYLVAYTMVLSSSISDAVITNSIRKNSTTNADGDLVYQTTYKIPREGGNAERTLFGVFQFNQNDSVQFWTTKDSGGSIRQVYGILSAFLVDEGSGGGGGGGFGEEPGIPLYNSQNIINTYSKSNQHLRYIEQVPFGIQVPGPLSLRERSESVIAIGKKLN
jgi:hypothetical protein